MADHWPQRPGPVAGEPPFRTAETLREALEGAGYLVGEDMAQTIWLAVHLGRPLLVEGPAGSGKTTLAKAMAEVSAARLVRLQCYGGLDESRILYEWDYRKQLLRIHAAFGAGEGDGPVSWDSLAPEVFSAEFLLARPLLDALTDPGVVLLLVDGVDLVTPEAEALLLEALSDFAVSIPELGTITASSPPLVLLTSNQTRELSTSLRTRCVVARTKPPTRVGESELVARCLPGITDRVMSKVHSTIDRVVGELGSDGDRSRAWSATLAALGAGYQVASAADGPTPTPDNDDLRSSRQPSDGLPC